MLTRQLPIRGTMDDVIDKREKVKPSASTLEALLAFYYMHESPRSTVEADVTQQNIYYQTTPITPDNF